MRDVDFGSSGHHVGFGFALSNWMAGMGTANLLQKESGLVVDSCRWGYYLTFCFWLN